MMNALWGLWGCCRGVETEVTVSGKELGDRKSVV